MKLHSDFRTTCATLAIVAGGLCLHTSVHQASAEPAPSPPEAEKMKADAEKEQKEDTEFTAEERVKLRKALSSVLNDPTVVASRDRARSAMETYKADLREAVKRASPELGEKVEKMLLARLSKGDSGFLLIKFRSFFKPMKEVPQSLRPRLRVLYAALGEDPKMKSLRDASMRTQDIPERSKIFGAMRARIAEIIEAKDPALYETLLPLPGMSTSPLR